MGAVTERKYAHGRPTPSLTPDRDEGVRPACVGRWDVYQALIDVRGNSKPDPEMVEEARNMCATCLLNRPAEAKKCLDENRTERWRAIVLDRKLPPTKRQTCGSKFGSDAHGKAGEYACADCKAAQNAYKREVAQKRRAAEIKHGTDTGYSRHRKAGEEACEPCKAAHRRAVSERAARKRQGEAA